MQKEWKLTKCCLFFYSHKKERQNFASFFKCKKSESLRNVAFSFFTFLFFSCPFFLLAKKRKAIIWLRVFFSLQKKERENFAFSYNATKLSFLFLLFFFWQKKKGNKLTLPFLCKKRKAKFCLFLRCKKKSQNFAFSFILVAKNNCLSFLDSHKFASSTSK